MRAPGDTCYSLSLDEIYVAAKNLAVELLFRALTGLEGGGAEWPLMKNEQARSKHFWPAMFGFASAAIISVTLFATGTHQARATEPIATIVNGASCAEHPDGSRCMSGFCADLSPLGFFCVAACTADVQCSEGYSCRFVEEGRGTRQGLCLPSRVIAQ